MIVNMAEGATDQQIDHIIERVREAGYQPHVTRGTTRTIIAAVGSGRRQGALNPAAAVRTHGQLGVGELLDLFGAAAALVAFVLVKRHCGTFFA